MTPAEHAERVRATIAEYATREAEGNALDSLGALLRLVGEADQLREGLRRAAFVAEHLHAMIDRETWRASGGDDGQGHYEGDYRAEQVADEIRGWKELASPAAEPCPTCDGAQPSCPDCSPASPEANDG